MMQNLLWYASGICIGTCGTAIALNVANRRWERRYVETRTIILDGKLFALFPIRFTNGKGDRE